jgi:hypothetical protein
VIWLMPGEKSRTGCQQPASSITRSQTLQTTQFIPGIIRPLDCSLGFTAEGWAEPSRSSYASDLDVRNRGEISRTRDCQAHPRPHTGDVGYAWAAKYLINPSYLINQADQAITTRGSQALGWVALRVRCGGAEAHGEGFCVPFARTMYSSEVQSVRYCSSVGSMKLGEA